MMHFALNYWGRPLKSFKYEVLNRDGNGSGMVRVEQISARDDTRNFKIYPYPESLADRILYRYPPGTVRISGTHRVY